MNSNLPWNNFTTYKFFKIEFRLFHDLSCRKIVFLLSFTNSSSSSGTQLCRCFCSVHRRNKMCIGIHWKHTFGGVSADNLDTRSSLVVSMPSCIKLTPGKHMPNSAFHFRILLTHGFLLSLIYVFTFTVCNMNCLFVSLAIIAFTHGTETPHRCYSLSMIKKV